MTPQTPSREFEVATDLMRTVSAVPPEVIAGGISGDDFKRAFRHHAAGVAVVSADPGEGPVAMTATSVASISAEPPLLVFSASDLSSSTPAISRAEHVVVHLLGAHNLDIARLCATRGADRFDGTVPWSRLPEGDPYFTGAATWVRGRVVHRLSAGTATLFVVLALEAGGAASESHHDVGEPRSPLAYHDRTWHALGRTSALPD